MGGVFKQSQEKKAKKHDILVIRIDKQDRNNVRLVNARPCLLCLEMMKSIGIRKVYYSIDYDKIIGENVKDMISIHTSKAMRKIESISKIGTYDESQDPNYWDNLIKTKLPDKIKESNYLNFMDFDFKSIACYYTVKIEIKNGIKKVHFYNHKNILIKCLFII